MISGVTEDSDTDSKIDAILLTFSESMTGAVGTDFAVTGLSA